MGDTNDSVTINDRNAEMIIEILENRARNKNAKQVPEYYLGAASAGGILNDSVLGTAAIKQLTGQTVHSNMAVKNEQKLGEFRAKAAEEITFAFAANPGDDTLDDLFPVFTPDEDDGIVLTTERVIMEEHNPLLTATFAPARGSTYYMVKEESRLEQRSANIEVAFNAVGTQQGDKIIAAQAIAMAKGFTKVRQIAPIVALIGCHTSKASNKSWRMPEEDEFYANLEQNPAALSAYIKETLAQHGMAQEDLGAEKISIALDKMIACMGGDPSKSTVLLMPKDLILQRSLADTSVQPYIGGNPGSLANPSMTVRKDIVRIPNFAAATGAPNPANMTARVDYGTITPLPSPNLFTGELYATRMLDERGETWATISTIDTLKKYVLTRLAHNMPDFAHYLAALTQENYTLSVQANANSVFVEQTAIFARAEADLGDAEAEFNIANGEFNAATDAVDDAAAGAAKAEAEAVLRQKTAKLTTATAVRDAKTTVRDAERTKLTVAEVNRNYGLTMTPNQPWEDHENTIRKRFLNLFTETRTQVPIPTTHEIPDQTMNKMVQSLLLLASKAKIAFAIARPNIVDDTYMVAKLAPAGGTIRVAILPITFAIGSDATKRTLELNAFYDMAASVTDRTSTAIIRNAAIRNNHSGAGCAFIDPYAPGNMIKKRSFVPVGSNKPSPEASLCVMLYDHEKYGDEGPAHISMASTAPPVRMGTLYHPNAKQADDIFAANKAWNNWDTPMHNPARYSAASLLKGPPNTELFRSAHMIVRYIRRAELDPGILKELTSETYEGFNPDNRNKIGTAFSLALQYSETTEVYGNGHVRVPRINNGSGSQTLVGFPKK